jgi:AMMECR1 domain-containing protein
MTRPKRAERYGCSPRLARRNGCARHDEFGARPDARPFNARGAFNAIERGMSSRAELGAGSSSEWPFVSLLATVARQAIAASFTDAPYTPPMEGGEVGFGLLVTLKTPDGQVRCCRGHLGGAYGTLVQEVMNAAVAAARSGGIQPPLRAAELDRLCIEIDLIHWPEPVASLDELDPVRYGLLVEQGDRRGLVLPGIEGVDSVEEQIAIACKTGALDPKRSLQIRRFTVDRVLEPHAGHRPELPN